MRPFSLLHCEKRGNKGSCLKSQLVCDVHSSVTQSVLKLHLWITLHDDIVMAAGGNGPFFILFYLKAQKLQVSKTLLYRWVANEREKNWINKRNIMNTDASLQCAGAQYVNYVNHMLWCYDLWCLEEHKEQDKFTQTLCIKKRWLLKHLQIEH